MEDDGKTTRVSAGTVAGIGVTTSRVRFCFDEMGLNRNINEVMYRVRQYEKEELSLDTLETDEKFLIAECVLSRDVELHAAADRANPDERSKANLDSWMKYDEYKKALAALAGSKYRISQRAVVALAAVADSLVHEFGLHAVQQTLHKERTNIMNKYMANGVQDLSLYPLVAPLASFQEFLTSLTEDNDETEKEIEAEDSIIENKTPKRLLDFVYYVGRIVKQHIAVSDDGVGTTRVTKEFKTLMSNLLRDFISNRMTNIVRVILRVRNAKTVSDDQIVAALEIMMSDSPQHADPEELLAKVNTCVDRWTTYLIDCKSGNKDVDQYLNREIDVEVPAAPHRTPPPQPAHKTKKKVAAVPMEKPKKVQEYVDKVNVKHKKKVVPVEKVKVNVNVKKKRPVKTPEEAPATPAGPKIKKKGSKGEKKKTMQNGNGLHA